MTPFPPQRTQHYGWAVTVRWKGSRTGWRMLGGTSYLFRRMEGPGNGTGEEGAGGRRGGAVAGSAGEEACLVGWGVLCRGVLWLSTGLPGALRKKIFDSAVSVYVCGVGGGVKGGGIAGPKSKGLEKLFKTLNAPLKGQGSPPRAWPRAPGGLPCSTGGPVMGAWLSDPLSSLGNQRGPCFMRTGPQDTPQVRRARCSASLPGGRFRLSHCLAVGLGQVA